MQAVEDRLRTIPRHRDLIGDCAEAAVAYCRDTLPDLRRAVIVLPHHLQQRQLRRRVLECAGALGYAAVLPPVITTLRALFRERARTPCKQPVLSAHERKLLLATALDEHPDLLPRASRWELADQLLQLFDDISDNHSQASPVTSQLTESPAQMLYGAWCKALSQTPDMQTLYRESLRDDALTQPDEHVFLCGFNELSQCESTWAARLHQQGRLTLITYAGESGHYAAPTLATAAAVGGGPCTSAPTDNARTYLLNAAFTDNGAIAKRASAAVNRFSDSPIADKIRIFKPESLEQHAFGIYLKIRDWLDAGVGPIAVVSQDRKLSRRLRAVLERADIPLCDHAGWALSTTSSAATVAALLPPAEQSFTGDLILTLARSPYCRYGIPVMRAQKASAELERALTEIKPFGDFDETIEKLKSSEEPRQDAQRIVHRIHSAFDDLRQAATNARQPLAMLFDALFEAMDTLGMAEALQKDEAGQRLLEEFEAMAAAATAQGSESNWNLWRRWILHTLERENFIPKERNHLVELYSLPQASLARPAGLIIAALDTGHTLPAEPIPLLDEDTRRALGLKGHNWRIAMQFERFRAALESADHILLTCQHNDNRQTLTPAPWLDGLQHFHALAYRDDLEERNLRQRAQAEARIASAPLENTPARPRMPAPRLPAWPQPLSVGAVQDALTCPYRFFARAFLKLRPDPEADDYDSPRSYGERLHRCLAALHTRDKKLPGPMDESWTEEHRDKALELARAIVEAEFAPYLDRHYSSTERMQKALEAVHWYVDWLINNSAPDAEFEAEIKQTAVLGGGLTLEGRPDCVIRENDEVRILDHKSGNTPSVSWMTTGEDIQLTAYALFYDKVKTVSYMNMKEHREVKLADEKLDDARERLLEHLRTFKRDTADRPLPAWANDADCRYCPYPGVCRRDAWRSTMPATPDTAQNDAGDTGTSQT